MNSTDLSKIIINLLEIRDLKQNSEKLVWNCVRLGGGDEEWKREREFLIFLSA